MAREAFARCLWLVDTIRRYKRITRRELGECWKRSSIADGRMFSRRTFFNYRDMVEELFNINILCDQSTYEYYIEEEPATRGSSEWLINSTMVNNLLTNSRDIAHRISLENVPSSLEYLDAVIDAIRQSQIIRFEYHAYNRFAPKEITLEPYFVKLFKQRWYVVGFNTADDCIKTYALDRVKSLAMLADKFEMPADIVPETYFRDAYGIVVSKGEVKKVVIRCDPGQAKYFAALPLHHSQQQTVADSYSLFTMYLRITDDFVSELLSHGRCITVLEPPELRARILAELTATLENYN